MECQLRSDKERPDRKAVVAYPNGEQVLAGDNLVFAFALPANPTRVIPGILRKPGTLGLRPNRFEPFGPQH